MENLKKNPLSLQLNVEDFAPASNDEKKSLVVMRESVNFWKDGMRHRRIHPGGSSVVQIMQLGVGKHNTHSSHFTQSYTG